jgi:prepilin peptidase CpaA
MTSSYAAAEMVLIFTAAILVYIAFTDLKEFKIRNEPIILLVGLFFIHAVLSGRWVSIYWNIGIALCVFVILLIHYSWKMMGGGDVKLLTVAFLWVGVSYALPFAVLLLAFAVVHLIALRFGWARFQQSGPRKQMPFGPSIAGALIGVFVVAFLVGDLAMNRFNAIEVLLQPPS